MWSATRIAAETPSNRLSQHEPRSSTNKVPLDDLAFNVNAGAIDFIGPADGFEPNKSLGTSVSWLHRATRLTNLTTVAGVDWYNYQNTDNTIDYLYYLREDLTTQLTPRLKLLAGLGPRLLVSYFDSLAGSRQSNVEVGGLASASFNYQLETTSVSGAVAYGLQPTSTGVLENTLNLSASLAQTINDTSEVGLTAQVWLSRTSKAGRGTLNNREFSISPFYSSTLARDWLMRVSYQFAYNDDDTGHAFQNAVYLTLSRSVTMLPP